MPIQPPKRNLLRAAWRAIALAALAALACAHAFADGRVALLIGNDRYSASPLRSAVNDAHDLGEALAELGFKVIVRENATRRDMIEAIREFGQALEGADTALFFYAGHAMQFRDRNYLVPIDAAMSSQEDVTLFSVEIGQVFDRMERARTRFNFVILDACRDNPFAASFRLSSPGLAEMSAPPGTLVAYATSPGAVAPDGFGRNGVYTKHILRNIRVPDLPAQTLFKRVREGVKRETRRLQTPWDSSSLKGDFVFNPSARPRALPSTREETLPGREIAPGVRELVFADGSMYRGGVRGGRLDGKGEYVAKTFRYEGDFRAGLKEGRGVYVWDNGDRYEGRFSDDRPDGIGEYRFANGDSYEGGVEAGVIAGRGRYTSRNGDVFEGSFANGKPDGVGVYRFASGDRYEGDVAQGVMQGHGRYIAANGDRIEAPFVDGKPHGHGTYEFANGDQYEGEILHGAITGQGVFRYASGLKYEGEVRDARPRGHGILWLSDGSRFEGDFEDGLAKARGELVKPDGSRAPAEIVDGSARLLN